MRLTMGQKQLESNPFPARSAAGPHAMGGIACNCMQITSPRHPHVFRFRNFGNHERTVIMILEWAVRYGSCGGLQLGAGRGA